MVFPASRKCHWPKLLFNLYINDITDHLDCSSTSKLFADDIKIYTELTSMTTLTLAFRNNWTSSITGRNVGNSLFPTPSVICFASAGPLPMQSHFQFRIFRCQSLSSILNELTYQRNSGPCQTTGRHSITNYVELKFNNLPICTIIFLFHLTLCLQDHLIHRFRPSHMSVALCQTTGYLAFHYTPSHRMLLILSFT